MKPAASRLPYLDVLRAVAILTVFFRHLPPEIGVAFGVLHEWGGRGVDLFFVLSGFLIGTTCLDRAERVQGQPRRQAAAYWVLRTFRIFPVYFGLLAIFALAVPGIHRDVTFVLRTWPLPYLTFTSNFFGQGTLELGIFWSLAIEEQFYLVVGVLVLLTARRRDTLEAAFIGLALTASAVAIFYRRELVTMNLRGNFPDPDFTFALFHSTVSRMDQLAIGLLAAVAAPRLNERAWAHSVRAQRWISWGTVGLILALMLGLRHFKTIGFTLLGLGFGAGVLLLQRPAARAAMTGLEARLTAPLLLVGKLSFGLYVFHPIFRPTAANLAARAGWGAGSLAHAIGWVVTWVGVTTLIAWTSYRFVEEPLLNIVRRWAQRVLAGAPTARGAEPTA